MIRLLKNSADDFYKYMGPIFGSRKIQRATKDRFYDDDGKEWLLYLEGGSVLAVLSMEKGTIKNIYGEDMEALAVLLEQSKADAVSGIVPAIYTEQYKNAGYRVEGHSANFVKITAGGTEDGDQ